MSNVPAQVQELRGIAGALRGLTQKPSGSFYYLNMAGRYFINAVQAGAFNDPKWVCLRIDAEHWANENLPFVLASDWFKENAAGIGLQIDSTKSNDDLDFWAPFFATLIDQEADAIEKRDREVKEAALKAPKNRWKAIHHWWQHNLYATIVVVIVGVVSALGGLISFVRELMTLLGKGSK